MQKAGPTDSLFFGTSIWKGLKAFIFYKINEAEASIKVYLSKYQYIYF